MGLSICYDLSLPAGTPDADVYAQLTKLREEAVTLPFSAVSELVRLTERDLAAPSPLRGLSYVQLEDVVDVYAKLVRDQLYRVRIGSDDEDVRVEAPADLAVVAIGFAVAPGSGSEPASFGLVKIGDSHSASRWSWWCCCKTQYASRHGNEHLIKCHRAVIALLDAAQRIGLECDVRDETGFNESRDESELLARVDEMNRIVARFAGQFSDAFEKAGGDSRQVQGEIFNHPDFERLESD